MSAEVQDILEAARALPPFEQLQILQGLAQSLASSSSLVSVEAANTTFWAHQSLEELAHEQHTPIFIDPGDLEFFVMPDWPADETVDDLLDYLHNQRQADRKK